MHGTTHVHIHHSIPLSMLFSLIHLCSTLNRVTRLFGVPSCTGHGGAASCNCVVCAFGLCLPLELSIATHLEAGSHAYTYNP
jgi:hypothetical protein